MLSPISETIENRKRQVVGQHIKCNRCGDKWAVVVLREGRFKVFCPTEQVETYLKTYNQKYEEDIK